MKIIPIFQKAAFAFIESYHRHHKKPVGSVFQIACGDGIKTPWGLTNVPEEPDGNSEKYYTLSEMGFFFDKSRFDSDVVSYNEALELALKNWIPIRVEDQEKVKKITWNWLCENEDGAKLIYDLSGETKICNHITWKPESKLYHIPEGMEFELDWNCDQLKINSVKCTIDCRCEVAGLKPCKQFYALKSKAEENLCSMCNNPVGNNVFTVCDDCWDLNEIKVKCSFKVCPHGCTDSCQVPLYSESKVEEKKGIFTIENARKSLLHLANIFEEKPKEETQEQLWNELLNNIISGGEFDGEAFDESIKNFKISRI